jgi:pteridine reductase
MKTKNILITGAGRRVGAAIARLLHTHGMRIILHYNGSEKLASTLCDELNTLRSDSARIIQADLSDVSTVKRLADQALSIWDGVDGLVNNASAFFPTAVLDATVEQWHYLMDVNARAPFFLSQALTPSLKEKKGCIVNIVDIHAQVPLRDYSIYTMTKSTLQMMTYSLAKELAPDIRVNGVSPGMVAPLEGENKLDPVLAADVLSRSALKREGKPEDIAKAVLFFVESADYVTGQILAVDGGRLLNC